ncbi:delayed-rectifier potassium channel regulatory subunit KCNS3-like [Lampetra planeri]
MVHGHAAPAPREDETARSRHHRRLFSLPTPPTQPSADNDDDDGYPAATAAVAAAAAATAAAVAAAAASTPTTSIDGSNEDSDSSHLLITVNVGGFRQRLSPGTLLRFPETRLGRILSCRSESAILQLCDDYVRDSREFYFDRHPGLFRHVLDFYRTGRLRALQQELCVFSLSQEIEYWGLPDLLQVASSSYCCSHHYLERLECLAAGAQAGRSGRRCLRKNNDDDDDDEEEDDDDDDEDDDDDDDDGSDNSGDEDGDARGDGSGGGGEDDEATDANYRCCAGRRRRMWAMLENPGYSRLAKVYTGVSIAVLLVSIISMCVHSMGDERAGAAEDPALPVVEDPVLAVVEDVCVAWFTLELAARMIAAPDLKKFFSRPLNSIDLVSVTPFYATLLLSGVELGNVGRVVQILRLMRVLRILKLARHSTGLRSLGQTLTHSYHEVGMLLLFLSVGISIFSVLIYSAERDEEEGGLASIPLCWWWATISMTTVGYGDTYPVTAAGKAIATACIICGILVVSLPITIIFNKFAMYYRRQSKQLRRAAAKYAAVAKRAEKEDCPSIRSRSPSLDVIPRKAASAQGESLLANDKSSM